MKTEKQKEIHFCHTADWHLDYYQYNKKERWEDFFKAANECVKLIIEEKPDFVIHCGDLFHQFRPTPGALKITIDILKKLKDAEIPLFIIRGNHDASKAQAQRFGGTVLTLLDKLGYLTYIQDETVEFNEFVTITGLGEYGKATGFVLEEVLRNHPIDTRKFNLVALHGYVQGQVSDSVYDMSGYELASTGYNYIALGHYHKNWEDIECNIFCPGSTEQTSINDWGEPEEDGYFRKSGFYSVKVKFDEKEDKWKTKAKNITFSVRPKGKFTINFEENLPIEEIITKSKEFILKHDLEEAIIKFHFTGILPKGMHGMINLTRLPANIEQKALHIIVTQDFSGKANYNDKPGLSNDKAIEELLIDSYNIEKKELDKWVELVNETLRTLGQKTISSENAEEIKVLYDLISSTQIKLSTKKTTNNKSSKRKENQMDEMKSNSVENGKTLKEEDLKFKSTTQSEIAQFFREGDKN